eukprot:gene28823-35753_t
MEGNNYPYRGAKFETYRGGNHVAGFVYGSESIIPKSRQGSVYDGQVHVTDWLPTLMGLATNGEWTGGFTGNAIDGSDQWTSLLTNTATAHPDIVLYLDHAGSVTFQSQGLKMILFNTSGEENSASSVPDFGYPDTVFDGVADDTSFKQDKINKWWNEISTMGSHSTADVVLKVGEVSIPAHRMILSLKSTVFRAMFDSLMQES